jgi:SAM-dependent methyltransferase
MGELPFVKSSRPAKITCVTPPYLKPYMDAARAHGGGFGALLWASPATQAVRFDAMARLYEFTGKSLLDVGCGRADLLDFLLNRGMKPAHYIGLEAVRELAAAAQAKGHADAMIVRADFVREPARLFTGADVIVFSGSLNTFDVIAFQGALSRAHEAAVEAVVFNFLDGPGLAAASFLTCHAKDDVMKFARTLGGEVRALDDYLPGDCTIAMIKPDHTVRC